MAMEGDFAINNDADVDPHPKFSETYQALIRKECFFLTMNEALCAEDMEDSEDELNITEMIHRAHTLTKSHFKGLGSATGADSHS